ncbi:hypothetical protein AXX17_AT5G38050 [Arabidopsis thaliana]|uniref:Uncharacterized protein n=1 Tax=Arabidopsis thaliana TaxID=3702 RepID=A0A178U7T7_ARATH|nr:hypothetical protein AXX17_AT5G38050 [Arabidopsis thaliana]
MKRTSIRSLKICTHPFEPYIKIWLGICILVQIESNCNRRMIIQSYTYMLNYMHVERK